MTAIPEELVEQSGRGNVLLFVGERIVHGAQGQAFADRLTAQLAARCDMVDERELSFPKVAQEYQDRRGRQALVQFLRNQMETLGDDPQEAHRLIAGLAHCDVSAATCRGREP